MTLMHIGCCENAASRNSIVETRVLFRHAKAAKKLPRVARFPWSDRGCIGRRPKRAVLLPHAARMGDESKAAGRSHARRLCCLNFFFGGLSGALRFLLRNNILLGK
jgi:hypothetical protein